MRKIQIKDIYIGKPDARDEIEFDGDEDFLQCFVMPPNFDLDGLIKGDKCFINGYKGTGKTALLYYIDNEVKNIDSSTYTSFLFFKEQYGDIKRKKLDAISKRIVSSLIISDSSLVLDQDFEYIWRWIFFKKIIEDNMYYNHGIFEKNREWDEFESIVSHILPSYDTTKKMLFPFKFKMSVPYTDATTGMQIAPEIELNFSNKNNEKEYELFISLIDEAEDAFLKLKKTDIPYYIFIDELEAYYGDRELFERDLKIIRDLVFTTRYFNGLMRKLNGAKSKIICSVRTEIINSINRFISPKELNKITSGFECTLIWDYNNTNSYAHPIIQILLKRIILAESKNSLKSGTAEQVYKRWFPEDIDTVEPANYILNNSWSKPRDIVRFLGATKGCLLSTSTSFNKAVFETSFQKYSQESLNEIKEELRALYTSEQINDIFNGLTGFRILFTKEELKAHAAKISNDNILVGNIDEVLQDLYRLGVVGNYSRLSKIHRYQHKGNDGIIFSEEWFISMHRALQKALSLSMKIDRSAIYEKSITPQIGMVVKVEIEDIKPHFLFVKYSYGGKVHKGKVHISQLTGGFIQDINTFADIGDCLDAKILSYDEKYKKWVLSFLDV